MRRWLSVVLLLFMLVPTAICYADLYYYKDIRTGSLYVTNIPEDNPIYKLLRVQRSVALEDILRRQGKGGKSEKPPPAYSSSSRQYTVGRQNLPDAPNGKAENSLKEFGPSVNKLRLDFEDIVRGRSQGMVNVAEFSICRRDILAEDRIKYQALVTYKVNQARMKQYMDSRNRLADFVEGLWAGSNRSLVDSALAMDGKREQLTWIYKLNGKGIWEPVELMPGHQ